MASAGDGTVASTGDGTIAREGRAVNGTVARSSARARVAVPPSPPPFRFDVEGRRRVGPDQVQEVLPPQGKMREAAEVFQNDIEIPQERVLFQEGRTAAPAP